MQVRAKGLARGNALGWDRAWNVPGVASTLGSQVCFVLTAQSASKWSGSKTGGRGGGGVVSINRWCGHIGGNRCIPWCRKNNHTSQTPF